MTRSPLFSTVSALIPLAALAFPLTRVLNPKPARQAEEPPPSSTERLLRADFLIRAAHPFEKVLLNELIFSPEEDEKELLFDPDKPLDLKVSWPAGTPETAIEIEIIADGQELKTRTYWATENLSTRMEFEWSTPDSP